MKKIWDMVRKISGKFSTTPITHLQQGNSLIDNPQDIANTLGFTLSHNSSSEHYTKKFQRFKTTQEKKPVKFDSDNIKNLQ